MSANNLKVKFKDMRALLEGFFGEVFNVKDPKPLKVGIWQDLASFAKEHNLPFSNRQIQSALRAYIRRKQYLKAVIQGKYRYDLNNIPVSEITNGEREYSLSTLKEIEEKLLERKKKREEYKEKHNQTKN